MLQYTSNLAVDSMKDSSLMDRQSTALIWEFLALLVRQNGVRLKYYVANKAHLSYCKITVFPIIEFDPFSTNLRNLLIFECLRQNIFYCPVCQR